MHNEKKIKEAIAKLIVLTTEEKIEWNVFNINGNIEILYPFDATIVGHVYQSRIEYNNYVIFRYRKPIYDDDTSSHLGCEDRITYELHVFDIIGVFLYSLDQSLVIDDLYSVIQNKLTPFDDIMDSILNF